MNFPGFYSINETLLPSASYDSGFIFFSVRVPPDSQPEKFAEQFNNEKKLLEKCL